MFFIIAISDAEDCAPVENVAIAANSRARRVRVEIFMCLGMCVH